MANSAYFDPAVGGDGTTVTDDANTTTGLDADGHRKRLVPAFAQIVAIAAWILTKANFIQGLVNTALLSPGTSATTTSVNKTLATGALSITLAQTGKAFALGQWVIVAMTSDPTKQFVGQITAFNAGTGAMTVNVVVIFGTGSSTDWTVSLTAPYDSSLAGRVSALEVQAATRKARRLLFDGKFT